MIIEIGEKLAAEKGDRGDIGYPGMKEISNYSSTIIFVGRKLKK